MSKKANPTIVGIFVVGALVLLVGGVVLFGSGKFFRPTLKYVAFFEGSASGLRKGAPVNFRGVRVGSVTEIRVRVDLKSGDVQIPVYFELEPQRVTRAVGKGHPDEAQTRENIQLMIDKGVRAQLVTQSFVTGQLSIELDFKPGEPAKYKGKDEQFPEFPTVPSTMEQLTNTLKGLQIKEMFNKLDRAITGIEQLVNAPETTGSIVSLMLAIEDIRKLIHDVNEQVKPIATALTGTLGDTRKLVKNVDDQVKPVSKSFTDTMTDAQKLVGKVDKHIDPLAKELFQGLADASTALKQATKTLATAEGVIAEDSKLHHDMTKALEEFAAAARAIRRAAELLQRHPEALFHGKGRAKGK